jgi:hydrogenase/urease accessory protein HupE
MYQLTAISSTFAPICKLLIASAISLGLLPAAATASAIFAFEGHTYRKYGFARGLGDPYD